MIDSLLFTWKEYRLKTAIAATVLIFGAGLLLSLLNSEPFDLLASFDSKFTEPRTIYDNDTSVCDWVSFLPKAATRQKSILQV